MTEETQATGVQYHDVTAAAYRIRRGVKETPLEVCALNIPHAKWFSMFPFYHANAEIQAAVGNARNEYLLQERISLANWKVDALVPFYNTVAQIVQL